jgi:hypothetical protein
VWNGDNPNNPEVGLHFIPLELKVEERATLQKLYGKLPPPPANTTTITKPDPTQPSGGLIAVAGFNDAKGLASDRTPGSPYPLGVSNRAGGRGEPGWAEAWPPSPNATFVKDVVYEGDGALHLRGTVNYGRRLQQPLPSLFRVEQYIRVPAGGGVACYIWRVRDGDTTGPMWYAKDGKFRVLDGDVAGGGKWLETGIPCKPDTWYKVALLVDVSRQRWQFFVDDKKFEQGPLGFRTKQDTLQEINYLVETRPGAYIDAVRFYRVSGTGITEPKKTDPITKTDPKKTDPRTRPDPKKTEPTTKTDPKKTAAAPKLPDGVIAIAGFNSAKGLGSEFTRAGSYPLGVANRAGGEGEPGWADPWPAVPQATFQSDVVHEGDGAVHLKGTVNYGRRLLEPLPPHFRVEQYVRLPAGGGILCYIWRVRQGNTTGPMWHAQNGKFRVLDGDERGEGKWLETGIACKPDTWYKVALIVDVARQRWDFFVDDKKFEHAPLGFRTNQDTLQEINYLVETRPGAYVDAVRFSRVPPTGKAAKER